LHPVLYKIGPLTLRTYGLFLSLSFVLAIALAVVRGDTRGVDRKDVLDLCFTIMVSSIIGSRIYYILTHLGEYAASPLRIFAVWEGGLSMFGGVVLALVASKIFLDRRGLSFARLADIIAPALMLGTFFTRIGCFMNGCCFGLPTKCSLGIVFPSDCIAGSYFPDTPIHPTQLYSSLAALIICIVLLTVDRLKLKDGFLFGLMLVLYSTERFFIEGLRFSDPGGIFLHAPFSVTYNQLIAVALFALGFFFMFRGRSPGEST
jgi:phosphatidylglycerol:prolipoprotein diacylglycerol transferase